MSPREGWPLEYRRLAGNDDEQDVNNSGITPFISMMFPNIEDNFLSIVNDPIRVELPDIMEKCHYLSIARVDDISPVGLETGATSTPPRPLTKVRF